MNDEDDFFVGYGALPDKDRRFLLKAIPAGLLGLAGVGGFLGTRALSSGGGRWETGTPVTLRGRIGFHPYPVLWVNGIGHVLAGVGKRSSDPYIRPFDGQTVELSGVKIIRNDCFMLGVAKGDIKAIPNILPPIPKTEYLGEVSLMGEILDAQCFMGIMNPGYGRSHRGCAVQCVRGGLPVFFSMGLRKGYHNDAQINCGGTGHLLASASGGTVNADILDYIAMPVVLTGRHERIGNLSRVLYRADSLRRV